MGDSSEVQLGGILYVTGNKGNSGKLISYGNHEGKYSINFYFGEILSFQMIKFYLSIIFYDISRKILTRGGVYTGLPVFRLFFVYKSFPSPQMGSGSYKNSYRELRMCSFRFEILVNTC